MTSEKVMIGIVLLTSAGVGLALLYGISTGHLGKSAPASAPQEDVSAALEARVNIMKSKGPDATLTILPVRTGAIDKMEDAAAAADLAKRINEAGLCRAAPAEESLLLTTTHGSPNEMINLWDLARVFQGHVRRHAPETDYVLYADYIFTPDWGFVMVHFVVCDRQGEWVIVDMQNSHHPDYQSIDPKSLEDCGRLATKRLTGYLR